MTRAAAEPKYLSEVVTPSGLEVRYAVEPKRKYEVRQAPTSEHDIPDESDGWMEVPSVTTVLEVLDKPALSWWGMTVGAEGVLTLHNMGLLRSVPLGQQRILACAGPVGEGTGLVVAGVEQVVDLLNTHKLTVNHVKRAAGERGQAVHDALEVWANDGTLPDPEMYPPEEQGYVQGLLAFLQDVPSAEPVASEVMVGSVEHGFAGRYDLRFRTTETHRVVKHRTPVRGPQYAELPMGLYLADLKTSKDVYATSHFRQLEAYEGASIECGYEPTDGRGVIHVSREGYYKFVRSKASFEDFLAVLAVWRSNQGLK